MSKLTQTERNAAGGNGHWPEGSFARLVPELDVTDLEASLNFWCTLLGFGVAYDRPAAGFAYLEREGAQIMLCEINGEWLVAPLQQPFGRGINLQIETAAVAPIVDRLAAAQWPLFRDVADSWYRIGAEEAGSREFLVQDPDGYLIRFSQHLGRRPAEESP